MHATGMDWLQTLLVFGGIWFWLLVAADLFLAGLACLYFESGKWATVTVVSGLLVLHFCGGPSVVGLVLNHPWYSIGGFLGFLALGIPGAIVECRLSLGDRREKYDKAKRSFLKENGVGGSDIPDELLSRWKRDSDSNSGEIPDIGDMLEDLVRWATYWPIYMAWRLLRDPIKKFFTEVFRALRNYLQNMANKMFEDVQKDFREPPPGVGTDEAGPKPKPRKGMGGSGGSGDGLTVDRGKMFS